MPAIVELDLDFQVDKPRDSAKKVLDVIRPQWEWEKVTVKPLLGGLLNYMWKCCPDGEEEEEEEDIVIIRIFNADKSYLDRSVEYQVLKTLNQHNVCMPMYCKLNNGYVYQYEQGDMLTAHQMVDPQIYKQIIDKLHQVHKADVSQIGGSNLIEMFPFFFSQLTTAVGDDAKKYLDTEERYTSHFPPRADLLKEAKWALKMYGEVKEEFGAVLVHGDPHSLNMIYNPRKDRVSLIDWDSTGLGLEVYDIGCVWVRDVIYKFDAAGIDILGDAKFKREWLQCYLETHPQYQDQEITTALMGKWMDGIHRGIYLCSFILVFWVMNEIGFNPAESNFWKFARTQFEIARRSKTMFSREPIAGCEVWSESEQDASQ